MMGSSEIILHSGDKYRISSLWSHQPPLTVLLRHVSFDFLSQHRRLHSCSLCLSLCSPGRSPSCYDNEIMMMNHVYKERFPKVSRTQTNTPCVNSAFTRSSNMHTNTTQTVTSSLATVNFFYMQAVI